MLSYVLEEAQLGVGTMLNRRVSIPYIIVEGSSYVCKEDQDISDNIKCVRLCYSCNTNVMYA